MARVRMGYNDMALAMTEKKRRKKYVGQLWRTPAEPLDYFRTLLQNPSSASIATLKFSPFFLTNGW